MKHKLKRIFLLFIIIRNGTWFFSGVKVLSSTDYFMGIIQKILSNITFSIWTFVQGSFHLQNTGRPIRWKIKYNTRTEKDLIRFIRNFCGISFLFQTINYNKIPPSLNSTKMSTLTSSLGPFNSRHGNTVLSVEKWWSIKIWQVTTKKMKSFFCPILFRTKYMIL